MVRKDYYRDFKSATKYKIEVLVKEIHLVYIEKSSAFKSIEDNKEMYEEAGVKLEPLYNYNIPQKIYIGKESKKLLPKVYLDLIKRYNFFAYYRIRNIKKQLRVLTVMKDMPELYYNLLQDLYNKKIASFMLKGNSYNLGNHLGVIRACVVPRSLTRKSIDWGESLKLKRTLIEKDIDLYNHKTGQGTKWLIFRTDENYLTFRWVKRKCNLYNKRYYNFRAFFYPNINHEPRETEEEVLNDIYLSPYNKMTILHRTYGEEFKNRFEKIKKWKDT